MASPVLANNSAAVEKAAAAVSDEARRRYFGIRPEMQAKVDPWATYQVVDAMAESFAGTIFHILVQVTDTAKVPAYVSATESATLKDEFGKNRFRGELMPSPPSPPRATRAELALMTGTGAIDEALSKAEAAKAKPPAAEFVRLRVWCTADGKYVLQGMVKGPTAAPLKPLEKDEFVGLVLRGRPG